MKASNMINSERYLADTLHHKKRRTTNSKSDQEQIPVQKSVDSLTSCKGLDFFRHINKIPRNYQADDAASNQKQLRPVVRKTRHSLQISREHKRDEQYVHGRFGRQGTPVPAMERRPMESGSILNLVGAEVRGKVDGAFDAGLLMTATVNGKIFRGVLFSPAPGFVSRGPILAQNHASPATQIPIVHQFPNSNHIDSLKPSHHRTTFSVQESSHSFRQTQMTRTYPVIGAAPSLAKESNPRSDLQGVVLTLGGPASGHV
ncbi:hypothetical protein OIU74_021327 [Salix koriyanagi]|uniref:Uncharacterized protein n=1 Tax=Salix koriyanagi TaxID=2511006 RepID=A0A9Q0SNF4_9ROSI|nr:hypothetical protein OIU74_021327 [Salix koriyanagi]